MTDDPYEPCTDTGCGITDEVGWSHKHAPDGTPRYHMHDGDAWLRNEMINKRGMSPEEFETRQADFEERDKAPRKFDRAFNPTKWQFDNIMEIEFPKQFPTKKHQVTSKSQFFSSGIRPKGRPKGRRA